MSPEITLEISSLEPSASWMPADVPSMYFRVPLAGSFIGHYPPQINNTANTLAQTTNMVRLSTSLHCLLIPDPPNTISEEEERPSLLTTAYVQCLYELSMAQSRLDMRTRTMR